MAVLCGFAAHGMADSFRERLNATNELLRKGDVEGALNGYRDLRVDEPESPELQYNMGCAEYQEALRTMEGGAAGPEENPFDEARASFEKALAAGSGPIRPDAAFNRANSLAQYAKHMPSDAEQDALIDAYQQSISAYEDTLRQFPEHAGARKNLDHMRYLLKKMLQNPPPPEDQQGKGENQPQEQQQQDEQQPEQSPNPQQGNESEQQSQQDTQAENEQDQSQEQEPQPNQGDEQQEQEPEQTQTASEPESQLDDPQSAEASESGEVPDRQTVEALLQSLEDRDQLEQRAERRQPRQTRIKGQWW